ncbi:pyridoxal phosphate-dependent aminotransferase [Aquimarina algicola]|uniref:Aminotransferase n=1 Tax=Aquimarina algicola TaxID=2589995 RepID=A0A504JCB6_9FLAO|nr:pyridoxal phosphate-dependent aminotransferase [Aquimarina algicola]TPN84569.1 pyridoxal phosphate-dependent aminotransferase [Aquimarina algicola]
MPVVSHKGKAMPESPIRKLAPFAEKAVKEGKHIFHLNIGQPDIKTPIEALHAIRNNNIEVLAYSHSAGFESFRKKLAGYYAKHDITISSDDILVTTGGSEALIFTMGSITDPGDEIIVPEPFYANYYSFSTQSNIKVIPVISKLEDGFALPKISEFEKLISEKTKAILICNPGNPTGYLYSKEEIKQLAALAKKYDLFLISDEVYREFVYDDSQHYSILQERTLDDHAIIVDSVSKRYSMCGARIGCLVSKNKSVIETAMKFAQARLSPPTIAQIASEAALEAPESYYKETVKKYKERRDTLITELNKIEGVKVATPKGAFYCIAELPVKDADHFAQWMLDKFDLNNQTVMLAPASGFYSSPDQGKNQVRIAYVLNTKDLKKSAEIIKFALKKYNNQ